jgi:multidrug efflux pump subunit AcrA (membrane-fusion protein)
MSRRELLSGLTVATLLIGCGPPPPKPEPIRQLRTMQVGAVTDLRSGQLPGRARSAREVNLAFDVSGTLIERPVSIGDLVEEDDLIARLDPRERELSFPRLNTIDWKPTSTSRRPIWRLRKKPLATR